MVNRALEPVEYPFFDYRRFTFSLGIAAGDRIWLSGSTAARFEAAKGMVVEGNLVAQAGVIYEKMKATLIAAQRNLSDVVRMVRYVTPAALPDLPALDAFQAAIFGVCPSVSTVVVKSLLRTEALIEVDAVAGDGGSPGIEYLPVFTAADRAAAWAKAAAALLSRGLDRSHILRAIEFMTRAAATRSLSPAATPFETLQVIMPCIAEQQAEVQLEIAVARNKTERVRFVWAEADPSKVGVVNQCRDIYSRLDIMLKQAGAGLAAVVKTTEFIVPAALGDYRKTGDLRREVFSPPYPAATGVICERLSNAEALISVEAIAVTEAG
jgi:enamine deaminase RidA (YjgF/YER057c/UK114 family)